MPKLKPPKLVIVCLLIVSACCVIRMTPPKLVQDPKALLFSFDSAEEVQISNDPIEVHGQYRICPNASNPMPNLQGMPVNLPSHINLSDAFIHKQNYNKLLTGDYALHRHTIPLLPESFDEIADSYKFGSCAIVGNGGSLKLTELGQAIDSHDIVVRINHAPVKGFEKRVGQRTTMRVMNSLWTSNYGSGRYKKLSLPLETGVTLLVSRSTGHAFDKLVAQMHKFRPDVKVLQISSRLVTAARRLLVAYRVKLCNLGYGPYSGGTTPSSGYVAVYIMQKLCKSTTLYGMGLTRNVSVPYHYFRGVGSRKEGNPVHSFRTENTLLNAMESTSLFEICRFQISSGNNQGNPPDARSLKDGRRARSRTNFAIRQRALAVDEDVRANNNFCG